MQSPDQQARPVPNDRRGRPQSEGSHRQAWRFGIAVGLATAACLLAIGSSASQPLPGPRAVHDALRSPVVRSSLRGIQWTRTRTSAVDGSLERVAFYDHAQIQAEFALDRRGQVQQHYVFAHQVVPYGNSLAYAPLVLAWLSLIFVLATAVVPLRHRHNLDVAAMLSLLAPVVLLAHRYVAASMVTAVPGLLWLLWRCAVTGLSEGGLRDTCAATPLLDLLLRSTGRATRRRFLGLLVGMSALTLAMVGLSSPGPVDVAYAVMEGATHIAHGVLPYGHLPGDVVHGDTYPILSYLAYVPAALIAPVSSLWDSVDLALGIAVLAAVLAAATAWAVGRRGTGQIETRGTAGPRAALSLLSYPPLVIAVSTGTTDVLLMALLTMAVLLRRRPAWGTGLVAAAAWFKLVPAALLPLWLAPMRGSQLRRAAGATALVSVLMLAVVLALGGPAGLREMLTALSYQLSRRSDQSLWSLPGLQMLQPLAQAAVVGLVAGGSVRLAAPHLGWEPRRLAAVGAAVLIGLQLAANYWTFLYIVWVLPLLAVSVLRTPASAEVGAVDLRPVAPPRLVVAT